MITPRQTVTSLLALVVLTGCSAATSGNGTHESSAVTSPSVSSSVIASSSPAPASTTATRSTSNSPAAPVPTTPLRTETVTAYADNTAYKIQVWVEDTTVNCEGHAYGAPVIAYLKAHLCKSMSRLLASTTVAGRPVGIAQALISFSGNAPDVYQTAGDFKTLVTQDGTGNITDLLREGKRFPNSGTKIGSPDAFSAQGQDSAVGIEDVWYLDGPTPNNAPELMKLAESLFLQLN
jgi:hypothetical protein